MDFDLRDYDRDDDLGLPDIASRARDDNDARELGRGAGDSRQSDKDGHDPRDETRWPERDREPPERTFDPREPFTRHLHLPRGLERELVRDRDREYTLRRSETRTLATHGDAAFEGLSSPSIAEAVAAGTARVECLVLPHTYRHLVPVIDRDHSVPPEVEKGLRRGNREGNRPPHVLNPGPQGAGA